MEAIAIVPYTSDAPSASSTEFISSSGELRAVRAHNQSNWAFMSPFVSFARRSVGDAARFVAGDHVVELHHVQDMNVRKGGKAPTSNMCSEEQKTALFQAANPNTLPPCQTVPCSENACNVPGCFVAFAVCAGWDGGRHCQPAQIRTYTDGTNLMECDKVTGSHHFYQQRWTNGSCPFVCEQVDRAPDGRACLAVTDGYFSPTCSNVAKQCSTPAGVQEAAFKAVANFSSPGNGSESGCEVTLAFPMAMPPSASISALGASLDPPFTAELYVNLSIADIPTSPESWSRIAILMGSFPNWYLGIGWYSSSSVQLVFYHSKITLTAQGSAGGSIIRSDPIAWGKGWRHVAVVVSAYQVSTDNIVFYVDGSVVSSGSRRVSTTEMTARPHVHPYHNGVFHVGAGNMHRFPEVLRSGRPYWDLPLFAAQVDELRVSKVALDSFSLGSQLPELRRRAACSPPYERIEGSTCAAVARLTPPNTSTSQAACSSGYEECGAMPGICMLSCPDGMMRQADCTCDCQPAHVQAWLIRAVRLTGSGEVLNATVYSTEHRVVGRFSGGLLPARIDLGSWAKVAVIAVRGGGSATMVSVEVETPAPESKLLIVPSLQDVALLPNREVLLHHARVIKYDDPSLTCALCPGEAPRSMLPRSNAMACRCAEGYGPDLLGKCVPLKAPLPIPTISLQNGSYHTAGTRVRLSLPALHGVEGPWLTEIRYEQGSSPQAPNCDTSAKYEEPNDGSSPGLDIIRRQQMVDVRAVVCHPTHRISLEARAKLFGNDHMNPPRCIVESGNMSTATTYALQLQVVLQVDQHPDAKIHYQMKVASAAVLYSQPLLLATPGSVLVSAWAEKLGFDRSATNICSYNIDGPARMSVQLRWPALKPGDEEQLGGYVDDKAAFLVRRGLDVLRFGLEASPSATSGVDLQYRLKRGELAAYGQWLPVPADKLLSLTLSEQLQAPNTTTVLRVEWRAKEPGYVWTQPDSLQVLLLATRTGLPVVEAEPTYQWALGDSWFEGPLRDKSLRQVHRITLAQPSFASRLFFSVRASMGQAAPASGALLLATSNSNVSSVSKDGLLEKFKTINPPADLRPDDVPSTCGGLDQSAGSTSPVPQVCAYLGPFEVLGGAVLTAFAITAGELESELVTLPVPKELEAPATSAFVAAPETAGNVVAIRSPGCRVLPSASSFLSFSLGQEGADRQSCVLASPFSQGSSGQNPKTQKSIHNCSWTPYKSARKLDLSSLSLQAGIAESAEDSLNITILTTVKRTGYLWSFPSATTYLWLRERAATPRVIQIRQPGSAATLATMVWLQHPSSSSSAPDSFFTLNDASLNHADLSAQFLREVPDLAAQVDALPGAFRPTQKMTSAQRVTNWNTSIDQCKWPSLCPLTVFSRNQTHFSELIYAPSSLSWLCAWAIWDGYAESKPGCKLLGPAGDELTTKPSFSSSSVKKQGYDELLGADILSTAASNEPGSGQGTQTAGRRLTGIGITSLPISLPRSHPMQYRYGAKCLDPHLLDLNMSTQELLTAMQHLPLGGQSWSSGLSPWQDLDMVGEDPKMPLPACYPHEHALFAVYSRLLTGLDQWSFETQSRAVLLVGKQMPVSIVRRERSLVLSVPSSGQSRRRSTTVLYRWFPGASSQPVLASSGGSIVQLRTGSVLQAYTLDEGVLRQMREGTQGYRGTNFSEFADLKSVWGRNELQGVHKSWSCTVPAAGSEAAKVEAALGPELCAWQGAGDVVLPIPSSASWTIWAAAYSRGLPLSMAKSSSVGAQCKAPEGIAFAASAVASCREGPLVDNSSMCSAVCKAGYAPSVAHLTCVEGVFQPPAFACSELPCQAPSNVLLAASTPCAEGPGLIAAGSKCTPSCQAGHVATLSTALQCSGGVLSPATFTCIEASCSAPADVIHAASPSCSGVGVVKSGEDCVPQCRSGYVPSQQSLSCRRGQLSPTSFECHPGVDTGLLMASIPSGIVAGSLALFAVMCCLRHPKKDAKSVEQPGPDDPIQDWLDCVKQVEPGTCVFCGDKPEELESTLEDHGPPTLFFCCSSCAATFGAEEDPDEDAPKPPTDAADDDNDSLHSVRTQGPELQLRRRSLPQPDEPTSEVQRRNRSQHDAPEAGKSQRDLHGQKDPDCVRREDLSKQEAGMPNLLQRESRDLPKQESAEFHRMELPEKPLQSSSHQRDLHEQDELLHLHKKDVHVREEDQTVHYKRQEDPDCVRRADLPKQEAAMPNLLQRDSRDMPKQESAEFHRMELPEKPVQSSFHQRDLPEQDEPLHLYKKDVPVRREEDQTVHYTRETHEREHHLADHMHRRETPDAPKQRCEPPHSRQGSDSEMGETVPVHGKDLAEVLKSSRPDGQKHHAPAREVPQRDPRELAFHASQIYPTHREAPDKPIADMHERPLSNKEFSDEEAYAVHQRMHQRKLPEREDSHESIQPDSPAECDSAVQRKLHGHRAEQREQSDESSRIQGHQNFTRREDSAAHQVHPQNRLHQRDEQMHSVHRDDCLGEEDKDADEQRGYKPRDDGLGEEDKDADEQHGYEPRSYPRKEASHEPTYTACRKLSHGPTSSDDESNRDYHEGVRRQRGLDQQHRQTSREGTGEQKPYRHEHDRVVPRDVNAEHDDWQELGPQTCHSKLRVSLQGGEGRREHKPVQAVKELRRGQDLHEDSQSPPRRGTYGMNTELGHRTPTASPVRRRTRSVEMNTGLGTGAPARRRAPSIEMTTELGSRAPPPRRRTRSISRPANRSKSKGGVDDQALQEPFDSGSTQASTRLPSVHHSSRSDSSSGGRQKGPKKSNNAASGIREEGSDPELQHFEGLQQQCSPAVKSPQRSKKGQQRPKTWGGHANCYDSSDSDLRR
eukprot:TRINITY_DN1111_c0_g1_i1.p1 TRINITY_DN1111_c0_g1~~TRINITY_DN1111_c0_g1_i1.p1  ORF type:complete len:3256 (+),score=479.82 TRINITY_DN1111_c0_g1_i1:1251-9770(+)